MSQKGKRGIEEALKDASDGEADTVPTFRSAAIEDRSSSFIGLFSPSLKQKEIQQLEEIASASHKIIAWRRESNQQSITGGIKYTTGFDDDGEKYGGKKIAKVLENMHVVGSCVVARWYGGVLLGPVRFEHIEQCATEAVKKWQESVAEEKSKKRRLEEEIVEKVKLVKVLADRDQSISVLRSLAVEKEDRAKLAKDKVEKQEGDTASSHPDKQASRTFQSATSETKTAIDYSTMPLERLKALEKARDATLSFLLKRIDKAEAELGTLEDHG
jgi:putative IMPACT (imprinted ancient) family translation regulator